MLTVGVKLPEQDSTTKEHASVYDVCHWPEFIALMQRLGIDMSKPYDQIVLDLNFQEGGLAKVYLSQLGADADKAKRTVAETTNVHNLHFRTYQGMPVVESEAAARLAQETSSALLAQEAQRLQKMLEPVSDVKEALGDLSRLKEVIEQNNWWGSSSAIPAPVYAPGWHFPPLTHGPLGKCFQCGVEMNGVTGPHDNLTKDDHPFCSDKCLSKYDEFKAGGG